jgi:hypothetical protein
VDTRVEFSFKNAVVLVKLTVVTTVPTCARAIVVDAWEIDTGSSVETDARVQDTRVDHQFAVVATEARVAVARPVCDLVDAANSVLPHTRVCSAFIDVKCAVGSIVTKNITKKG